MQTQIVARVAEFIRNPEARKASERSADFVQQEDKVEVSAEARRKYDQMSQVSSQWEKERTEHVENVRQQVQHKTYRMTSDVVNEIALRIVSVL